MLVLFGFKGCKREFTLIYDIIASTQCSSPPTSGGDSAQRLLLPPGPGHVFISGYRLQQGAHRASQLLRNNTHKGYSLLCLVNFNF